MPVRKRPVGDAGANKGKRVASTPKKNKTKVPEHMLVLHTGSMPGRRRTPGTTRDAVWSVTNAEPTRSKKMKEDKALGLECKAGKAVTT